MNNFGTKTLVTAVACLLFAVLFGAWLLCFKSVGPGKVGIVTQFGNVKMESLASGPHWLWPTESVIQQSTRPIAHATKTSAGTSMMQSVDAEITVTYWLDPKMAPLVYSRIGNVGAINAVLLDNNVQQSLKAVTGGYTAEALLHLREEVKKKVEESLRTAIDAALADKDLTGAVIIGAVAIKDFEFSKDFNDGVDRKVVSEQEAMQAESDRDRKSTIAKANAEAQNKKSAAEGYQTEVTSKARTEGIRLKTDALRRYPGVLDLRRVQQWDGNVPEYYSCGKVPFIDVELVPCK